jgi:diguanylate cyclase (GGDEF)-like protein/PAS domain S-box-containing protein
MHWEHEPGEVKPRLAAPAAPESGASAAAIAALATLARERGHDPVVADAIAAARDALDRIERDAEAVAARYRSLIDAVPDAVTLHDETGRILEANDAACAVYGYSPEQLKQLTVFDLNPDLAPSRLTEVLVSVRPGHSDTVETTNRRADGTTFPVEVRSNVYIDGDARRIVAIVRDITNRHAADRELRASEARYRGLLRAMDKGVLVQNARGRIVSVNPAGCRLLGLTEVELTGADERTMAEWRFEDEAGKPLPFDELPGMRSLRVAAPIESTLVGVWLPHLRIYRWFSISTVPQYHAGRARPFQVISTFSDVTALKRASELFAKTQTLASIGGWEYDAQSAHLFWTEEMYRIHDLPAGSPVTIERALGFLVEADRLRLEASLAAAQRGQSFELEARVTSAIGRRRWVCVQGQPLRRHGKIHGVSGTLQDITERKLHEDELRRLAQTDVLTGLASRDTALADLERAIERAGRGAGPALLFVDLDRFKVVNDMLGHAAGDRLLAEAAGRLRRCAGGDAEVSRFAGDAFLLLLPAPADAGMPQQLAERVTAAFGEPFDYAGEELQVTASVGIARWPDDGATAQQLVNHADAAVNEAKRRGRNTWQGFTPQLARGLSDRLMIESQLRRALDNGEFRLEYQPTIDLATGRVVAAEALLRWNNRQLGELPPAQFVSHAENSGDIVRIGAWVIREACRQLREWRARGIDLARVAVNVSYRQFLNESLVDTVRAALRESSLDGAALELEMTERVLIDDVPDTFETFAALRQTGVSLTIDDFGEGYSALNYLRRLPIDGIKISHAFMQGIPGNRADSAICEAIVRMARSLGLNVTGEGVETEAQRQFLVGQGTPLAQGFLFSRPLAPARFVDFIDAWNRRAS